MDRKKGEKKRERKREREGERERERERGGERDSAQKMKTNEENGKKEECRNQSDIKPLPLNSFALSHFIYLDPRLLYVTLTLSLKET